MLDSWSTVDERTLHTVRVERRSRTVCRTLSKEKPSNIVEFRRERFLVNRYETFNEFAKKMYTKYYIQYIMNF